jgi:hypothetical protein
MSKTDFALPAAKVLAGAPVERPTLRTGGRLLSMALSILVLAAAAWQGQALRWSDITALIPYSWLFWVVLTARIFASPVFDWLIFRRLWGVGRDGFVALVRKLVYNELLLGYLGEAYFYTWAKRRLPAAAHPFGAVKDVAILSAVAGNVTTLLLIALAYPYLALLPLADYGAPLAWSLALIVGVSLGALIFSRRVFSLKRGALTMSFTFHMARIVVTTVLTALAWHLVLPKVAIGWWLMLSAVRHLVGRLPFVPNKEIVFAGIAVLALPDDVAIAALMAMLAALTLAFHLVLGLAIGLYDLVAGDKP